MVVKSFNSGWNFCLGGNWLENESEAVCLPHCVELSPANSSGCRNYQGKCIYRKNFFAPKEYEGKKVLLEFEGAMGVSVLSVNGVKVKEHFCGYTPLVAEVEEFLKLGENNLIEVCLDNSDNPEVPPGKPQADLDFAYEGGIYRNAWLKVQEKLHITHPLLANEVAGGGIFVWNTDVSDSFANVHARVHIKNEFESNRDFTLKATLIENGEEVGAFAADGSLDSGDATYLEGVIAVNNPKLWSPEEPNLYTLRCEIVSGGEVVDAIDTEIGIRDFYFTLDDGVIFNGKSRRFNGANYHQTWPYIGNAVPDSLLLRDMMQIKSMGMDNIRSHYPFSTSLMSDCNRLGLTVIVSNIGWQFFEDGIFWERAIQNMRDIIRWHRNNPCIIIWEPMLNESRVEFELQAELNDIVHEEYPYKPFYTASDWGPTDIAYVEYDPGMLGGRYMDFGLKEETFREDRPLWIREYGDYPDDFFNQSTVWRCKRGWGDAVMVGSVDRMLRRFEGNIENTRNYIDVYNNKKLCGYGIWPAIAHNRGYHINPCWGGHLDLFRVPKFSYYFMQSQCDREDIGDILYIASWWAETSPSDVTVFSNAERVQLYWGDTLIAEQEPDNVAVKHPPFTFKDVRRNYKLRERSTITAKAIVNGEVVAESSLKAPGIARKLKLEAEFMDIPLKADGADIVAVRCSLIDSDGGLVPLTCDDHPIVFEIEGEGEIVGDSKIGANPICAEAGIATVLVRSTEKAGEIKLRARMLWEQPMRGGIQPDELIFSSEEL